MTHEEIVSKYFNSDHLGLQHPYKERAIKAMAEAVKYAIIDFEAANKEANELMNAFQKGAEAKIIQLEKELAEKYKEIANLTYRDECMMKEIDSRDKEIAELKEAAENLVQLKIWEDINGKDEYYLKSVKPALDNLKNLITK